MLKNKGIAPNAVGRWEWRGKVKHTATIRRKIALRQQSSARG